MAYTEQTSRMLIVLANSCIYGQIMNKQWLAQVVQINYVSV